MKSISVSPNGELREAVAINLRDVIRRLIQSWKVILLFTIAGLIFGLIVSLGLPTLFPRYTAETYVLLTGARYQAKLDDKITTVDSLGDMQNIVAAVRANEYQVIAESGETAALALQEYKRTAPNGADVSRMPGTLSVRVRGALVVLTVSAGRSDEAVQAAKAYATATSQRLDTVYGQTESDRVQIEGDLKEAGDRLASDQQKLVDFYKTSRLDELNTLLQQRQYLRGTLVSEETASLASRIQNAAQLVTDLGTFRHNTETLRQQIDSAGDSPASVTALAVALASLQMQLAQLDAGQPLSRIDPSTQQPATPPAAIQPRTGLFDNQLRIDAATIVGRGVTRDQLLADTTALLSVINDRESAARQDLASIQDSLKQQSAQQAVLYGQSTATVELLQQLSKEEQGLKAQIQDLKDREARLSSAVEQSKTAQSALASKAQELSLLSGPGSGQALIASTPQDASLAYPSRTLSMPLTTLLGFMLGIAVALFRARH